MKRQPAEALRIHRRRSGFRARLALPRKDGQQESIKSGKPIDIKCPIPY